LYGATNVLGQKAPVATIGTVLYDKDGVAFTIKKENSWTETTE
jgi:phenylalanyl-tRNA synthetase beta chain